MPIHDLGYRGWKGKLSPYAMRWWVIATNGIKIAWRSFWLRRMLLLAWAPALTMGLGFFLYEQYRDVFEDPQTAMLLDGFGRAVSILPNADSVVDGMQEARRLPLLERQAALADLRHDVWALLLLTFFRYPQGVLMVLIVGLIAPPLISSDLRTRAFLFYFSRPITHGEYILGKAAVVWCYLMMITMVPSLVLYVFGVLLSPDLSVVYDTWDLPIRIIIASAILLIPTTALALMFSSLTSESRFAGYAWFSVWALGWVAYLILTVATTNIDRPMRSGRFAVESHSIDIQEIVEEQPIVEGWTEVSLIHMLWKVEGYVFGLEEDVSDVLPSAVILLLLTFFAIYVLQRRVSAPTRV